MEWERDSTDIIEQQLIDDDSLIGSLRARQMKGLAELDTRRSPPQTAHDPYLSGPRPGSTWALILLGPWSGRCVVFKIGPTSKIS